MTGLYRLIIFLYRSFAFETVPVEIWFFLELRRNRIFVLSLVGFAAEILQISTNLQKKKLERTKLKFKDKIKSISQITKTFQKWIISNLWYPLLKFGVVFVNHSIYHQNSLKPIKLAKTSSLIHFCPVLPWCERRNRLEFTSNRFCWTVRIWPRIFRIC